MAESSPWVLQGLPHRADMDEQYKRLFQSAAESSAPGEIEPARAPIASHGKHAGGNGNGIVRPHAPHSPHLSLSRSRAGLLKS
jgi:hypothetical protein